MGVKAAVCCALFGALLLGPPAQAAFPGQNGRLAVSSMRSTPQGSMPAIVTLDPDGTDVQDILTPPPRRREPAWSPDGAKLAYVNNGDIAVANADGSGEVVITSGVDRDEWPTWSPDGARIAFQRTYWNGTHFIGPPDIYTVSATGGTPTPITSGGGRPAWSPDGTKIAFERGGPGDNGADIFVMNSDGSGQVNVTNDSGGHESEPDWSPDGSRLVYGQSLYPGGVCCTTLDDTRLEVINANGTGEAVLHDTIGSKDESPAWSPDGTKVVFIFAGDGGPIHVVDVASGAVDVVASDWWGFTPDWQPVPINAYPRPKGATPIQVPMVPAYTQCTSPNRTHGPPLAFPSCASPTQASDELTVGTPDANAKPAKSRGTVRYDALAGAPATPADEADVRIAVELFDIYEQGTLADYTGELRAIVTLRITDKLNTPHPGGPGAATVTDASLGATVPCTATADTTEGATCSLITTFDALVPGTVTETKRSIWALGPARLQDGGADSDADTTGDNTPFMTQGLFIP